MPDPISGPEMSDYSTLRKAARPFAVCTHGWDGMGYGPGYTCLDRAIDIAKPDHPTRDWWPTSGICDGCKLARVLGRKGKGTLTPEQWAKQHREDADRREFARLKAKYEPTTNGGRQ